MLSGLREKIRLQLRGKVGLMRDWRVHAGAGVAIGGALVAILLGRSFDPWVWSLALIVGVATNVTMLILRRRELKGLSGRTNRIG